MTKKEMYEAIKEVVIDNAEMVEFIDRQIELINKKSVSSSNSKRKLETEKRAELVYNALTEMDKPVTLAELRELTSNNEVASYTPQRLSALMTKLGDKVTKEKIKGKMYFAIA